MQNDETTNLPRRRQSGWQPSQSRHLRLFRATSASAVIATIEKFLFHLTVIDFGITRQQVLGLLCSAGLYPGVAVSIFAQYIHGELDWVLRADLFCLRSCTLSQRAPLCSAPGIAVHRQRAHSQRRQLYVTGKGGQEGNNIGRKRLQTGTQGRMRRDRTASPFSSRDGSSTQRRTIPVLYEVEAKAAHHPTDDVRERTKGQARKGRKLVLFAAAPAASVVHVVGLPRYTATADARSIP